MTMAKLVLGWINNSMMMMMLMGETIKFNDPVARYMRIFIVVNCVSRYNEFFL